MTTMPSCVPQEEVILHRWAIDPTGFLLYVVHSDSPSTLTASRILAFGLLSKAELVWENTEIGQATVQQYGGRPT
jgi:hypothetical protein